MQNNGQIVHLEGAFKGIFSGVYFTLEHMGQGSPSLKLFAYSGKENGLIIVGSHEELQELASKLQAATAQEVSTPAKEWPHEIVFYDPQIGPYKDQHDWRLSFHIEGTIPAEQIVPLQRSANMPSVVVVLTFVLAFVGFVALVRGAWNVF